MGFLSSLFGSEYIKDKFDYGSLKTDVHSHLIPGIDDGSPTMEHTIEMLHYFSKLGYQKVITTPHVMIDYYKNTPEIILSGLKEVQKAIEETDDLDIKIEAAAEYYLDDYFMGLIEKRELLTFGDSHVLFELSFNAEPPNVKEAIFNLVTSNYKPVLAHVERYPYYGKKIDRVKDFKARGALIQMNINSLSGNYGPDVKKMAIQLIESGLVDVICSDCHRLEHLETMASLSNIKYLHQLDPQQLLNVKL